MSTFNRECKRISNASYWRHLRKSRRGTIYIIAMGASLIVACLAIAGLQTVRVQRRLNEDLNHSVNARRLAEAGIEFAQHKIATDANWRSLFVHGAAVIRSTPGGSFSVTLADPVDGNIANQSTDAVVVTSTGTSGASVEKISARLEAQKQLFPACRSSLYATERIKFNGGTTTSNQWCYCANEIHIDKNATVNLNACCDTVRGSYDAFTQRLIEGGKWPMEMPNLDASSTSYIGTKYNNNAVTINVADIPTGGDEMIRNGGFETNALGWSGYWCFLSRDTTQKHNGVASCKVSLQLTGSGPLQEITGQIIRGRRYIASAWVRTTEDQEMRIRVIFTGSSGTIILSGAWTDAKDREWTKVSAEFVATWSGSLTKSEFFIDSEENSTFHFDEASFKDAEREPGTRYIENVVLGSGNNPYGSKAVSSTGVYAIAAPLERILIRNCRINGTILVSDATKVEILGAVSWEPTGRNYPAIISNAIVDERTSETSLSESAMSVNFNPSGSPYLGATDSDSVDSYPSVLRGPLVSTNNILIGGKSTLSGPVLTSKRIEVLSSNLQIQFPSDMILNPPPGFFKDPPPMRLNPSSVQKVP